MIEVLRICQLGFPEADISQIVELEVRSILLRFLNFLLIGFFFAVVEDYLITVFFSKFPNRQPCIRLTNVVAEAYLSLCWREAAMGKTAPS